MNRYRIIAAAMGLMLAAFLICGCSDNNSENGTNSVPDISVTDDTEDITESTTEKATKKSAVSADFGSPSEVNSDNLPQPVFIMDDGSYVYPIIKNGSDGPEEVYVSDSHKGTPEELKLPKQSAVYYSDGERLYFYSPDEGLCVYENGSTKPLNKETKAEDSDIPERSKFFFTKDRIFFACRKENSTVIKSMDYSGKITDESYSVDYKKVRIIGTAETDGKSSLLCSYSIGTDEHIIALDSKNPHELKTGRNSFVSGKYIYYINIASLCRRPLDGGDEETVAEKGCANFCFLGERLFYADATSVYSVGKDGKSEKIFGAEKLTDCDFISDISAVGDRLFVSGGSGVLWKCIAEIDEKGSLIEEIETGIRQ